LRHVALRLLQLLRARAAAGKPDAVRLDQSASRRFRRVARFGVAQWWDKRQWQARQDAMRRWDKEHPERAPFQGTQEEYDKWRAPKYEGKYEVDLSKLENDMRNQS
jgi:hypothetical protein